jgi:hypothetical protein
MLNTQQSEKTENNKATNDFSSNLLHTWDPLNSTDWNQENPTSFCLQRVKKYLFATLLIISYKLD